MSPADRFTVLSNSLETLKLNKDHAVATVTLHRPERLNAINSRMIMEIDMVMDLLANLEEVKVVIVTGGEKIFSAGADISEVVSLETTGEGFMFSRKIQKAFGKLSDLPQPVIAAVAGLALGGGFELTLACDLRIASEGAFLGVPEIDIGVIPGAGGTQRLPRLLGASLAKDLIITGRRISSDQACRLGLVNKVVPDTRLIEETLHLALEISEKPPLAVKMAKQLVNTGMDIELEAALKLEAHALGYLFASEDKKEGMEAFLAKRKAVFKGK